MDPEESMFLFEITVEELTSYINCREFRIQSQFADVFHINLKDPNEVESFLPKRCRKHAKRTSKVRTKPLSGKQSLMSKVQTGQSILFAINVETLISNMKQYPMELSLWSKVISDYKIGSTQIPWNAIFIDNLSKLNNKYDSPPINVTGDYNVFHELTSKRMAVIKLNIKLTYLKDKVSTQPRTIYDEYPHAYMNTCYNSKNTSILSSIDDRSVSCTDEPGTIKTIYTGGKRPLKDASNEKNKNIDNSCIDKRSDSIITTIPNPHVTEVKTGNDLRSRNTTIASLIKSETSLEKFNKMAIIKSKSCSSVNQEQLNIFNYIFGGNAGPFGNQVYCVGYFTVENDFADSPKSLKSLESAKVEELLVQSEESGKSEKSEVSEKSENPDPPMKQRYKLRVCDSECPVLKIPETGTCAQSICSLDLPQDAAHLITVKKCERVVCDHRTMRELPFPPDDRILIDLNSLKKDCCDVSQKVEGVVGGMQAKMKFGEDPCFCECECRFGFTKRTTYCNICGGFEVPGDDTVRRSGFDMPFPCPIFHKLVAEKGKTKTLSITGSDTKREKKIEASETKREKKIEGGDIKREKKIEKDTKHKVEKIIESERVSTTKKGKKKKKDERFQFNYGYSAPQIGHSRCAMPCNGSLGIVPKGMGWLWNAENIPGMKFRPQWKPGATNKHIVRLLKIAKNPGQVLAKKRKKEQGKGKRPLKRPLLTVQKKDGEYTVTMETMKTYTKPRTFNQHPYEDKPLVTYTIGRTEEENLERMKKKERARRRLERLQREFIQSAFRDMCQEICLKTYQQALGILPDAEKPDCLCYPAQPGSERTDLDHSCSCSEDKSLTESDTDSDEWIVEFTPPNATFDPTYKNKKIVYVDNFTQYSYLDYKVKLVDRYGNPVPRFFKTADGKQHCSDLGGFWGPNNKWLEINTDGYIGPDEKWAPNSFLGPNGELVDAEIGKFQALNGKWLVVGIDGYVDAQGKWKFYTKAKPPPEPKKRRFRKVGGDIKDEQAGTKASEATWSCFGSVSPKQLSKMGIVGHGHDKKLLLSTLQDMLAHGEDVKIPEPSTVPRTQKAKGKHRSTGPAYSFVERRKCKHAPPSDKGIVAVDGHGNKTYFRLKDYRNRRPKQRMASLTDQGISLSSFHVPCFHSFISSEMAKKQKYERQFALSKPTNKEHATPKQKYTTTSTQNDTQNYSVDTPSAPYSRIV